MSGLLICSSPDISWSLFFLKKKTTKKPQCHMQIKTLDIIHKVICILTRCCICCLLSTVQWSLLACHLASCTYKSKSKTLWRDVSVVFFLKRLKQYLWEEQMIFIRWYRFTVIVILQTFSFTKRTLLYFQSVNDRSINICSCAVVAIQLLNSCPNYQKTQISF